MKGLALSLTLCAFGMSATLADEFNFAELGLPIGNDICLLPLDERPNVECRLVMGAIVKNIRLTTPLEVFVLWNPNIVIREDTDTLEGHVVAIPNDPSNLPYEESSESSTNADSRSIPPPPEEIINGIKITYGSDRCLEKPAPCTMSRVETTIEVLAGRSADIDRLNELNEYIQITDWDTIVPGYMWIDTD